MSKSYEGADQVRLPPKAVDAASQGARLAIVTLLCALSAVSYLERVSISVLSPLLMGALDLDQPRMGQVFSAFLLGYALFQYPSGFLADRFGTRRVLGWAMFAWGVLTIATALIQLPLVDRTVGSFGALMAVRFLLGVAEAPTYPGSARVVSTWFHPTAQGRATSVFSIGMAVGSAVAPPLVARLMLAWGWKVSLWVLSTPALFMAWLWGCKGGDGPLRQVSAISSGGEAARSAFRDRNVWLLAVSYFLNNYVFYVFVFWFFPYLVQVRGFDIVQSSWIATAPWILTLVATGLGGGLLDWLTRRFGEPWGRRMIAMPSMVLAGLLLHLGAKEQRPFLAITELTLCEGLVMLADPVYWSSAILLSPSAAGTSGGFMNMGGNLGGFVSASLTPLVASWLGWTGSLDFTAALTIVGALLWFWITPTARAKGTETAAINSGT